MKNALRAVLIAGCLLLPMAGRAYAQNPGSFVPKIAPGDIGPQEDLQLTAGSGVVATWGGVYVGPYEAKLTSYPGQPTITIYCDDFLNASQVGDTWTANVAPLTLAGIATTRLGLLQPGNATNLGRYMRAAWLAAQFATNRTRSAWSAIHSAIWSTVLPGDVPGYGYSGQYVDAGTGIDWLAAANAADLSTFDASRWRVLTDVLSRNDPAHAGTQEYLVEVNTVTPEPATLVMLATGLLMLVGLTGYRRRTSAA